MKKDNNPALKSPTMYFNKQLFSPRSKNKAKSSSNLNVRRFSTDSVFNSQTLKNDRSSLVGRRLSKDATSFLSTSPPDINSRRSSYLDIITTGGKLAGKSPVLSIENVSECSLKSDQPIKLSDSESIGRKLATLPKYASQSFDKQKLQPQYSLNLGKSAEGINKLKEESITQAKSYQNITESKLDRQNQNVVDSKPEKQSVKDSKGERYGQKGILSDDEVSRRNKLTSELQSQFAKKKKKGKLEKKDMSLERTGSGSSATTNSNTNSNPKPPIRIQVEDTSKPEPKMKKYRQHSLGDNNNIDT